MGKLIRRDNTNNINFISKRYNIHLSRSFWKYSSIIINIISILAFSLDINCLIDIFIDCIAQEMFFSFIKKLSIKIFTPLIHFILFIYEMSRILIDWYDFWWWFQINFREKVFSLFNLVWIKSKHTISICYYVCKVLAKMNAQRIFCFTIHLLL